MPWTWSWTVYRVTGLDVEFSMSNILVLKLCGK